MEIELKQAEVVLKKTKITKSIVSQLISKDLLSLEKYKVLGWVLHDKVRKIILWDEGSKDLTCAKLPKRVVLDRQNLKITFYNNIVHTTTRTNDEEAKKAYILIRRLKNNAESVGQIFI